MPPAPPLSASLEVDGDADIPVTMLMRRQARSSITLIRPGRMINGIFLTAVQATA
jgi:hypothetical protein